MNGQVGHGGRVALEGGAFMRATRAIGLAVVLLGPVLVSFVIGWAAGAGRRAGGAQRGAVAGFIIGALSQGVGFWFRSTPGFGRWVESLSLSTSGGRQSVVTDSTSPGLGSWP